MARIPNVMLVFSSQSVTSSGTVTSEAFKLGRDAYASIHYVLSTATTGLYVACTAQILLAGDDRETFVLPVDTANQPTGVLAMIDSNSRFVRTSFPLAPWGKLQLKSSTNNTITFAGVYLIMDEVN